MRVFMIIGFQCTWKTTMHENSSKPAIKTLPLLPIFFGAETVTNVRSFKLLSWVSNVEIPFSLSDPWVIRTSDRRILWTAWNERCIEKYVGLAIRQLDVNVLHKNASLLLNRINIIEIAKAALIMDLVIDHRRIEEICYYCADGTARLDSESE